MTHRSVRRFGKRQIPDAILEKIITGGTFAPSAPSCCPEVVPPSPL
ncbi:MAG: nitroreductase family protein [Methanoregula sp.]